MKNLNKNKIHKGFFHKTKGGSMISIYRYINDISLNGKEYLLNEENQELKFSNKKQAFNFLSDGGIEAKDEEELEDYGIYLERKEEA